MTPQDLYSVALFDGVLLSLPLITAIALGFDLLADAIAGWLNRWAERRADARKKGLLV